MTRKRFMRLLTVSAAVAALVVAGSSSVHATQGLDGQVVTNLGSAAPPLGADSTGATVAASVSSAHATVRHITTHMSQKACDSLKQHHPELTDASVCTVETTLTVGAATLGAPPTQLMSSAALRAYRTRFHLQSHGRVSPQDSFDGSWYHGWAAIESCGDPGGLTGFNGAGCDLWYDQTSAAYIYRYLGQDNNPYLTSQVWIQGNPQVHCWDKYGGAIGFAVTINNCYYGANGTASMYYGNNFTAKGTLQGNVVFDATATQQITISSIDWVGATVSGQSQFKTYCWDEGFPNPC